MRKVDTILGNAKLYAVDDSFKLAEAMAIESGRVVAVGAEAEISASFEAREYIDAGGRPVYPGFIDPHSHFLSRGLLGIKADLFNCSCWSEAVGRLGAHDERLRRPWVEGRGWDQNLWACKGFPSKLALDALFPGKPVIATRVDGHAAVVNSAALALAGIDASTRIEGGEIELAEGEPTGLLLDAAADRVLSFMPPRTREERVAALKRAQADCFAVGLTSVSEAGIAREEADLICGLQASGELSIRVYAMLMPTDTDMRSLVAGGPRVTDRFSMRSLKLIADGALGSRGALLLEPYSDEPGNKGIRVDSPRKMADSCEAAYEAGFQVNTHCIGDASARETLELYSRFLAPGNDLRWRIEHAQTVHPSDIPRFGELSVIPSIQTTHATSDMRWAKERLGPRLSYAFSYRKLMLQNGWIANGSDFPIEGVDPLRGFYAAVFRKDDAGEPEGGFQVDEALTRDEALRAMTSWAAKANFEEGIKGSLEAGKLADFVILDRDIMAAPEDELRAARVIRTYVSGRLVYERK